MKQALHIFGKDVFYLWREVLLVVVLAAMFAYIETRGRIVDNPFGLLLMPAACWLIARLIQAEALAGDKQYWITRPYDWRALLASKLLFIVTFVNLPILLSQLATVIAGGFPVWNSLPGLLWTQVLFWFCMSLPLAALSATIDGIVPLILTIFVLFVATVGPLYILPFGSDFGTLLGPFEWVKDTVLVLAAAASAALVLRAQYKMRATIFSRIFLAAGGAVAAIAYIYLPLPLAFAAQSGVSRQRFDGSSLRVGLAEAPFRQFQYLRDQVRVDIPISVDGVPPGTDVQADAARVQFQWPDGRVWKSRPREMVGLQKRAVEGNVFDGVMLLSRSLSDAERNRPVKLDAAVYFTLFGNARSRTIAVRKKPVNVMDGVQCFMVTLPGTEFLCRALFRWPTGLVSAKFSENDLRPFRQARSYSPFPAGLGLGPIETHSTEGTPTLDKEVAIIVKEPIAHIRRDFEVRDVRLVDLVRE